MLPLSNLLRAFISPGRLPPEFEPDFYRLLYPDLRSFSTKELAQHYADYGRAEGRLASPAALASGFLATIPDGVPTLEIGPFTRPRVRGKHVKYMDVLGKEALIERALALQFPIEYPVDIDYVSPDGSLSGIPDRSYKVVVSSHCIEHQPDLIWHLNEVARILVPGGRYYLIIPDHRYCFDHFLSASSVAEIRAAKGRRQHTPTSVLAHACMTTHNDSVRHWKGDHGPAPSPSSEQMAAAQASAGQDDYIDVHAWQFTPESFRQAMSELFRDRAIGLRPERVFDTPWGELEFTAVLRKPRW